MVGKAKCRACKKQVPLGDFNTTLFCPHTESCSEDFCQGITTLCYKCWIKLRPEERLKHYLDLLMTWPFKDEDERIRTESAIAHQALRGR